MSRPPGALRVLRCPSSLPSPLPSLLPAPRTPRFRLPALVLLVLCVLVACGQPEAPRSDAPGPARTAASAAPAASGASAAPDPNDPAEPGIPDLARLARYVFRTMQQHDEACPVANRYRDTLHFAFAIDVAGGRMTRVGLAQVAFEGPNGQRPLPNTMWPRELAVYAACLEPALKAVAMSPAPADGGYEPAYSFPGRPDGLTAP